MTDLHTLLNEATCELNTVTDLKSLDDCRVAWLGKQGKITAQLKNLGQLPADQRRDAGQKINEIKNQVAALIEVRLAILNTEKISAQLAAESVDVSLPGRRQSLGSLHPVSLTRERISQIFMGMGFDIEIGPEIEDDYHNFAALNIAEFHPARAMQDTFYFDDGKLLRTHTSTVQIRTLKEAVKENRLPLRAIAPGRVYRRDFDVTHTPMFHQVEGLCVDEANNVSFASLKGIIIEFLRVFFSQSIKIRFRASYFPFTEPSAEVDITCQQCHGAGCRICKHTGWLEVLGCGMVHPRVLAMAGVDSEKYSGWAFGVGLDRLTMLRYNISDLRALFENDLRLLQQFSGLTA